MIVRVRILFTFTGGSGHFLPAVPLARVARARGHEVAFSCQEAMLNSVLAAGFPALGSGGRTLAAPEERRPLLPVDRTREENVIRDSFAGSIARERAVRLLTVAAKWRPDVVVRDEGDFGAAVAAEVVGIPHVSIVVLAAGGLIRPDLVAEPLDALRAEHGLSPDPQLAMLHRYLTVVPVPPSFRTPADPLPATARHIQPAVLDPQSTLADQDEPTARTLNWLAARPDRPTVYFTLGTVFHQESGDLFPRILEGLVELDANIVVTVGREIDPAELGKQPANVHIERFIPQGNLLPYCNAVISHAGSGSVIGALALGVPLVLLPMGADQPLNADRCEALGVARVLDPITTDSDDVHDAVLAVLHDPAYQEVARKLETEISRLPTAEDAVTWIEITRA
jgi:MGT family glycosyltransferase